MKEKLKSAHNVQLEGFGDAVQKVRNFFLDNVFGQKKLYYLLTDC
jgi:hypothetical protein